MGTVEGFKRGLMLITLAALVLRVGYILVERGRPLSVDGFYYHFAAGALADGSGFVSPFGGGPIALHPPGWPLVLSLLSSIGMRSVIAHQVFACAIGAGSVALVGLAGRAVAGRCVGLISAGLAAVNPTFWLYERPLLSEVVVLPLVVTMVLVAQRHWRQPNAKTAASLGAVCGLLTLVRSEQVLQLGLVLLPVVLLAGTQAINRRTRVMWSVLGLAVGVAVIAPWTVYNANRFEEPVLLTTNFGLTARIANCPGSYEGEYLGHLDDSCYYVLDSAGGDESVSDLELRDKALDYAMDNRSRLPFVLAAREGRTWGVFRPLQQARLDATFGNDALLVHHASFVVYWMLVPCAAVGALLLRRRRAVLPLLLLAASITTVTLATAITLGQPRIRVPAEVLLTILAATAIEAAVGRSSGGQRVDVAGEPDRSPDQRAPSSALATP